LRGGNSYVQKDLLQAKRILITGGGTGLGKAAAQRFLELGAEVYLCGRRQDVLAATEQELHERTAAAGTTRRSTPYPATSATLRPSKS